MGPMGVGARVAAEAAGKRSLIQGTIESAATVIGGVFVPATCLVDGASTPVNIINGRDNFVVGDRVGLQLIGRQYLAFSVTNNTPWTPLLPLAAVGTLTSTASYGPPAYRVNGDVVELRGTFSNSATTTNSETLFQLPTELAPLFNLRFAAINNGLYWNWDVIGTGSSGTGAIRYSSGSTLAANTNMSLNGVSYSVLP